MSTYETLKEFLDTLKSIEEHINELQGEADAIKDLVKEEMRESGVSELHVGNYKITYRDVISNRFDTTSFKKSYNDLYKEYTRQTTYKRLTIN